LLIVAIVVTIVIAVVAVALLRRGRARKEVPSTRVWEPEVTEAQAAMPGPSMFCRKCGAKIPRDSDFCMECGEKTLKE